MKSEDKNARERIFQAVLDLLAREEKVDNITTRQIANMANVNSALINYYFQSKENLLSQVAQNRMIDVASHVVEHGDMNADAAVRLKELLNTTASFNFKYNQLFKIVISGELKMGCKNSYALVMPFLKEIFRDKNEQELKIIALQLLVPFHEIVLYPEVYGAFLNTDFFDETQRTAMINKMVVSILSTAERG